MSSASRVLAVFVGLVVIVLAAAALVREVMLAVDRSPVWPLAERWERLVGEPSWTATGVVALACAVVAAGLLLLAVGQGSVVRKKAAFVTIASEHGATNLDAPALERVLRRRLEAAPPDLRVRSVAIGGAGAGCRVRVEADMPVADLVGAQARAFATIAPDLERLAGLRLVAVDIVVVGR